MLTYQHFVQHGPGRLDLTDQEIVCLSGGHTLGANHPEASGHKFAWDLTPTVFDNGYFTSLIKTDWVFTQADGGQFEATRGGTTVAMLPSDMVLFVNLATGAIASTAQYVNFYAQNQQQWFDDFVKAWVKLTEMSNLATLHDICVDGDKTCPQFDLAANLRSQGLPVPGETTSPRLPPGSTVPPLPAGATHNVTCVFKNFQYTVPPLSTARATCIRVFPGEIRQTLRCNITVDGILYPELIGAAACQAFVIPLFPPLVPTVTSRSPTAAPIPPITPVAVGATRTIHCVYTALGNAFRRPIVGNDKASCERIRAGYIGAVPASSLRCNFTVDGIIFPPLFGEACDSFYATIFPTTLASPQATVPPLVAGATRDVQCVLFVPGILVPRKGTDQATCAFPPGYAAYPQRLRCNFTVNGVVYPTRVGYTACAEFYTSIFPSPPPPPLPVGAIRTISCIWGVPQLFPNQVGNDRVSCDRIQAYFDRVGASNPILVRCNFTVDGVVLPGLTGLVPCDAFYKTIFSPATVPPLTVGSIRTIYCVYRVGNLIRAGNDKASCERLRAGYTGNVPPSTLRCNFTVDGIEFSELRGFAACDAFYATIFPPVRAAGNARKDDESSSETNGKSLPAWGWVLFGIGAALGLALILGAVFILQRSNARNRMETV